MKKTEKTPTKGVSKNNLWCRRLACLGSQDGCTTKLQSYSWTVAKQKIAASLPATPQIERHNPLLYSNNLSRLQLRPTPARLRRMAYLIGTDEAGYGPNLGPLVISATLWEAPDGVGGEDLFDRLGHVITPELREKGDSPHLCEAGHRPKAGRGPSRQMGTVPFFRPRGKQGVTRTPLSHAERGQG